MSDDNLDGNVSEGNSEIDSVEGVNVGNEV